MNQLTERSRKLTDGSDTLQYKWLYTYDGAGNLKTAEYQNGAAVKQSKWVFTWNPRKEMTLAEKFSGTNDTYAGKVAYIYCLTCDGALSQRIEYSPTVSTTITSWKRYEYDGLNLLRVDERYDNDVPTNGIDDQDPWRKKEVSTHKPGSLGNLLGKMVYFYTGANQNTDTPSASYFYAYFYDAVGNLLWTVDNSGYLNYTFSQDAFGNDLSVSPFSGNPWSGARTYCANEHQTGKWIDPFTGLYFFHARFYDPVVGRFVGKCQYDAGIESKYLYCESNPVNSWDLDGAMTIPPKIIPPSFGEPIRVEKCYRRARIQGKMADMQDTCGCHPHVYLRVVFSSGDMMRWGRGDDLTGYEELVKGKDDKDEEEVCTPVPHKVGCVLKAISEMLGGNLYGSIKNKIPYRGFLDPTTNCSLFPRQILNRCQINNCYIAGFGYACINTYPDQPLPEFSTR